MDLEIIEFVRPDGKEHSLYITGVSPQAFLEGKFSDFGLLYEVQVIDTNPSEVTTKQTPNTEHDEQDSHASVNNSSLYAFVKFYSTEAAHEAKLRLTGRLYLSGQHLKIRDSTRKQPSEPTNLYVTRCYELANFYLGFNGWCLSILMIRQNEEHTKIKQNEVQFVCGIKLDIKAHGLSCEGYGVATMEHDVDDPTTKSVAHCRAKKQSYNEAVQNAFRRVMLVVLGNGKVYAEVNSTVEERVYCDEQLTTDKVLKVNDLDLDPVTEDSDDFNDSLDVDLINQQLLEELEEENS